MNVLKTNRLCLRGLQYEDAYDIFEYCKLPEVIKLVGMRLHESLDITEKYITHELQKSETYAIELTKENKVIGTVSLRKQYNESDLDIRSISCVINPNYWGQGYAPEAIRALIRYGFEEKNVHKVLGGHYSFNTQSEKLNKKLGFVYEGRRREVRLHEGKLVDELEYSMLLKDYLQLLEKWPK